MEQGNDESVRKFLELIKNSGKGKLKVYIGMSAGVGKTYRMLQEAHALLLNGLDVQIGFIETHNRPETHALLQGLEQIPRRSIFYKGKKIEEMDLQAIINRHPEVVIIDELAHSNSEGSRNAKRWQDVKEVLQAGINVITAVNIQHIESLQEEIKAIAGINVSERVPDSILADANEIVNIDLSTADLIERLKTGKIYKEGKIGQALQHFFKPGQILQLRELALQEVARHLYHKIDTAVPRRNAPQRLMACISSNHIVASRVIRKSARLAAYYRSDWVLLYVQTDAEIPQKIRLDKQRHLINNFKLAIELGAEVIKIKNNNIPKVIVEQAAKRGITTVCMGKTKTSIFWGLFKRSLTNKLIRLSATQDFDLIILS